MQETICAKVNPRLLTKADRLFTGTVEGRVIEIDGSRISSLSNVKALVLKKSPGDRVILPPKDYDNRFLGYCIGKAAPGAFV